MMTEVQDNFYFFSETIFDCATSRESWQNVRVN